MYTCPIFLNMLCPHILACIVIHVTHVIQLAWTLRCRQPHCLAYCTAPVHCAPSHVCMFWRPPLFLQPNFARMPCAHTCTRQKHCSAPAPACDHPAPDQCLCLATMYPQPIPAYFHFTTYVLIRAIISYALLGRHAPDALVTSSPCHPISYIVYNAFKTTNHTTALQIKHHIILWYAVWFVRQWYGWLLYYMIPCLPNHPRVTTWSLW